MTFWMCQNSKQQNPQLSHFVFGSLKACCFHRCNDFPSNYVRHSCDWLNSVLNFKSMSIFQPRSMPCMFKKTCNVYTANHHQISELIKLRRCGCDFFFFCIVKHRQLIHIFYILNFIESWHHKHNVKHRHIGESSQNCFAKRCWSAAVVFFPDWF